jgi:hypothetical protein
MPKTPNPSDRGNSRNHTADIPKCSFEHIPDADLENQQIKEIANILVKLLKRRYPQAEDQRKFLSEPYPELIRIQRGVHPISYGCLQAVFEIDPDLSKEYQVGLFAKPGKQYKSIIRFSNLTTLVGPDIDMSGSHCSQGMAIKLFKVDGKMLSDDKNGNNHDFLMINQPNFTFANIEDYLRLHRNIEKLNDRQDGYFLPLKLKDPTVNDAEKNLIMKYVKAKKIETNDIQHTLWTYKIVQSIQITQVANPLGIPYFSAAPYLFGPDRVMKFSARPRVAIPPAQVPQPSADNYLRNSIIETLHGKEPIVFDFLVQIRKEVGEVDIENATTIWDEKTYPFTKVATITIPSPQEVDNAQTIAHCEQLAFTPWHALPEHQPIGSINRLRKTIYEALAEYRRGNN